MISCKNTGQNHTETTNKQLVVNQKTLEISPGANQTEAYLPLLKGKRVGVVTNQSGIIKNGDKYVHLVDSLLNLGVKIQKVFAPEHGFRGLADAGEHIQSGKDTQTGLEVVSLYGKNKKPYPSQLENIDIMVFDLQDVGVRFYTYISTLHYVMEACAENNIPIIVLDRPNPNAHYIDGPVLEPEYKSFIGMHPVPVVYGMTIGEYGKMINGEKWLDNKVQADLTIIPVENYTHSMPYDLPVKPSPNLPNAKSVNLYPSLCFFEGTQISVGRGTEMPFQIYGSPYLEKTGFSFTPKSMAGATHPKWEGRECYGVDLRNEPRLSELNLEWLKEAFEQTSMVKTLFFNEKSSFNRLAGNDKLKQQIINRVSMEDIRKSWQKDLDNFKKIRKKYLIYKD